MKEKVQILNTIETDIEKAVALCEKEHSRADIFEILSIESVQHPELDIEKQICILKLDKVNSQKEADLLVFHQTEHHSLIREACSQKINEFMKNEQCVQYFQTKEILNTLLKAVNDINPNICRTIIEILPLIGDKKYFLEQLYERFDVIFDEIEKMKRSRLYTKKLFNLYWGLETLAVLDAPVDENLESVLLKSSKFRDYTIREKTAMVLSKLSQYSSCLEGVKASLKNDENFYVRRYSSQW